MSLSRPLSPVENRLLAALPDECYKRLLPFCRCMSFASGNVIYEPGEHLTAIYFPTTSLVSLLYTTKDGATTEMGMVGNEGVVGIALFLGGETTPHRAVALITGGAISLTATALREEFQRGGALQRLLLRYTQALLTQTSQTAVCNRLHLEEQRLCRWLLSARDRINSDELHITHELISHLLGGRRESVTVAAHHLQDINLIRYTRGHITILDRAGLEAQTCECYQVVKNEFARLLS